MLSSEQFRIVEVAMENLRIVEVAVENLWNWTGRAKSSGTVKLEQKNDIGSFWTCFLMEWLWFTKHDIGIFSLVRWVLSCAGLALDFHSFPNSSFQVPLYVHDDSDPSPWPVRGAGLWWRHVPWALTERQRRDVTIDCLSTNRHMNLPLSTFVFRRFP